MTEKQFKRISGLAFDNVDTMFNNITKILETGKMPEEDNENSRIAELLSMLEGSRI